MSFIGRLLLVVRLLLRQLAQAFVEPRFVVVRLYLAGGFFETFELTLIIVSHVISCMTEKKLQFPTIPIQRHAFFADEADITSARFSLVGGTATVTSNLRQIYSTVFEFRRRHNMFAELKWTKISNQKIDAYRDLVNMYFEMVEKGMIAFHCATFDNSKWKHHLYNDGDRDLGLSKNYYQLILHQFIARYGEQASCFVCLDRRHSSTTIPDLQTILNKGAAKDYGLTFGPLTGMEARDSKTDDMLQINDVILGATSAIKNSRHLDPQTRAAKVEIANLVLERSKLRGLEKDTPPEASKFTVWNRIPR